MFESKNKFAPSQLCGVETSSNNFCLQQTLQIYGTSVNNLTRLIKIIQNHHALNSGGTGFVTTAYISISKGITAAKPAMLIERFISYVY